MMRTRLIRFMALCALACACVEARATIIASDNASNAPYATWDTGDNGGTGMGAWTLTTGGNRFYYVSTSTANADGSDNGFVGGVSSDGDIDTSGVAWGMTAFGGDTAEALRTFNSPLSIGGTLSIDFDNGYINGGGTVGFAFQNDGSAQNMFEFFFVGGDSFYTYVDEGGSHTSTVAYGDEGLTLVLTRTGLDSYSAVITRRDGSTQAISGDFGGVSDPSSLDKLRFFNANAGGGTDHNAYFNSIIMTSLDAASVPEPSVILLLMAGAGLLYARRAVR